MPPRLVGVALVDENRFHAGRFSFPSSVLLRQTNEFETTYQDSTYFSTKLRLWCNRTMAFHSTNTSRRITAAPAQKGDAGPVEA